MVIDMQRINNVREFEAKDVEEKIRLHTKRGDSVVVVDETFDYTNVRPSVLYVYDCVACGERRCSMYLDAIYRLCRCCKIEQDADMLIGAEIVEVSATEDEYLVDHLVLVTKDGRRFTMDAQAYRGEVNGFELEEEV